MSKKLPNGIEVINVTAHDLIFWEDSWSSPVCVSSDAVVNASPYTLVVGTHDHPFYILTTVSYHQNPAGRRILDELRKQHPDAVFVGSVIAAQAYRGEVYAPVPHSRGRKNPDNRLLKATRFTVFPTQKDELYHGEENAILSSDQRVPGYSNRLRSSKG